MKKMLLTIAALIFIILILPGCSTTDVHEKDEGIFTFKNSYVGDNSAVGAITSNLPNPNGEQLNGLELKTTTEPYGIILNYSDVEKADGVATDYKELALYNATYILALVHNADWVQFNFIEQELLVTREKLHSLYEIDIREYSNEEELSAVMIEKLSDENNVNMFFQ